MIENVIASRADVGAVCRGRCWRGKDDGDAGVCKVFWKTTPSLLFAQSGLMLVHVQQ